MSIALTLHGSAMLPTAQDGNAVSFANTKQIKQSLIIAQGSKTANFANATQK